MAVVLRSPFLKIGITFGYFKISGRILDQKHKLIRTDIGLDKHFLKSLRILVGTLTKLAVLYAYSVLGMTSASSFLVGGAMNFLSLS